VGYFCARAADNRSMDATTLIQELRALSPDELRHRLADLSQEEQTLKEALRLCLRAQAKSKGRAVAQGVAQ